MGAVRFEVFLGIGGRHYFRVHNKEGAVVLTSKGYQHRDACMEAIRAVKEHAASVDLYVKKIEKGKTSFALRAPNRQVLAEGGPFAKPEACDEAIDTMRMAAQAAVMEK